MEWKRRKAEADRREVRVKRRRLKSFHVEVDHPPFLTQYGTPVAYFGLEVFPRVLGLLGTDSSASRGKIWVPLWELESRLRSPRLVCHRGRRGGWLAVRNDGRGPGQLCGIVS